MKFQNTGQPDWDWWGKLWPTPSRTVKKLGVSRDSTVLDIGSGDGYFTIPTAEITDKTVYAIDVEKTYLHDLQKVADLKNIKNISCILLSAYDINCLNISPDIVLLLNLFHGASHKEMLIQNIYKILSHDGKLAIVNWKPYNKDETMLFENEVGPPTNLRMRKSDVLEIVSTYQFKHQETIEFVPYHYGMIFNKN